MSAMRTTTSALGEERIAILRSVAIIQERHASSRIITMLSARRLAQQVPTPHIGMVRNGHARLWVNAQRVEAHARNQARIAPNRSVASSPTQGAMRKGQAGLLANLIAGLGRPTCSMGMITIGPAISWGLCLQLFLHGWTSSVLLRGRIAARRSAANLLELNATPRAQTGRLASTNALRGKTQIKLGSLLGVAISWARAPQAPALLLPSKLLIG